MGRQAIEHVKRAGKPTAPQKSLHVKKRSQRSRFTQEKREDWGDPSQKGGLYQGNHVPAILYYYSFPKGDHGVKQQPNEGSVISYNCTSMAIVSAKCSKNKRAAIFLVINTLLPSLACQALLSNLSELSFSPNKWNHLWNQLLEQLDIV